MKLSLRNFFKLSAAIPFGLSHIVKNAGTPVVLPEIKRPIKFPQSLATNFLVFEHYSGATKLE